MSQLMQTWLGKMMRDITLGALWGLAVGTGDYFFGFEKSTVDTELEVFIVGAAILLMIKTVEIVGIGYLQWARDDTDGDSSQSTLEEF